MHRKNSTVLNHKQRKAVNTNSSKQTLLSLSLADRRRSCHETPLTALFATRHSWASSNLLLVSLIQYTRLGGEYKGHFFSQKRRALFSFCSAFFSFLFFFLFFEVEFIEKFAFSGIGRGSSTDKKIQRYRFRFRFLILFVSINKFLRFVLFALRLPCRFFFYIYLVRGKSLWC